MAAPMMAWCLDEHYRDHFHQTNWLEQSFIVPSGIESTLTPLMESVESEFHGIKVFSLPSVGDPIRGGVFAKRHIELGVKGDANIVPMALEKLKSGTADLGFEVFIHQ